VTPVAVENEWTVTGDLFRDESLKAASRELSMLSPEPDVATKNREAKPSETGVFQV
jgi:hypothetical protein